jgi:hypothetical protein
MVAAGVADAAATCIDLEMQFRGAMAYEFGGGRKG